MTFEQLMQEPATREAGSPTIGDRLAELLFKNGGQVGVGSWGVIELGGLYGHVGLEQEEALELIHLGGLIRGYGLASDRHEVERQVITFVRAEWERKRAGFRHDA